MDILQMWDPSFATPILFAGISTRLKILDARSSFCTCTKYPADGVQNIVHENFCVATVLLEKLFEI